ncbi:hypothetical protein Gotur_011928 [Gossypium turneri]
MNRITFFKPCKMLQTLRELQSLRNMLLITLKIELSSISLIGLGKPLANHFTIS